MKAQCCLACMLLNLAACVGPNFHRPAPPEVSRYTADEPAAANSGAPAAQRFLLQAEVPRNWWLLFGSE